MAYPPQFHKRFPPLAIRCRRPQQATRFFAVAFLRGVVHHALNDRLVLRRSPNFTDLEARGLKSPGGENHFLLNDPLLCLWCESGVARAYLPSIRHRASPKLRGQLDSTMYQFAPPVGRRPLSAAFDDTFAASRNNAKLRTAAKPTRVMSAIANLRACDHVCSGIRPPTAIVIGQNVSERRAGVWQNDQTVNRDALKD